MDEMNGLDSGKSTVSDGLKIGVSIGSLFIPLLGIIMGLVFMSDNNPEKKKVGKLWLYIGLGMFALSCVCTVLYCMLAVLASAV